MVSAEFSCEGAREALGMRRVFVDVLCTASVRCGAETEGGEEEEETIAQQRRVR